MMRSSNAEKNDGHPTHGLTKTGGRQITEGQTVRLRLSLTADDCGMRRCRQMAGCRQGRVPETEFTRLLPRDDN